MILRTLSIFCFFISIFFMIIFSFYEKRIIECIKRIDPTKWTEYTYFFGQRLKYRKFSVSIRTGKYSEIDVLNTFKILKIVMLLIWVFFAAFLLILAISQVKPITLQGPGKAIPLFESQFFRFFSEVFASSFPGPSVWCYTDASRIFRLNISIWDRGKFYY
jgi:hypothetical protein